MPAMLIHKHRHTTLSIFSTATYQHNHKQLLRKRTFCKQWQLKLAVRPSLEEETGISIVERHGQNDP